MRVALEYGRAGLIVDLPDDNVAAVMTLREAEAVENAAASVLQALESPIGTRPLRELARGRKDACIVVCDITRPVPNPVILPEILATLASEGIPPSLVTILIATGTHRPNDAAELLQMLGEEAASRCQVINHVCTDEAAMESFGDSPNGVPITLNRHYTQADLKITVGMIEPHFMAGYAGGRKMVMPGIAGLESVQAWHSPKFLEHPRATNGAVEGNPVHEEALWIAKQCRPDFIIDVALDKNKKIAAVFAGDMESAWNSGVAFVAKNNTVEIPEMVDVAITTCGGYPLDLTYYQAVKGMVGVVPIVKPGGTIIIAAECAEGIGNSHFRDALFRVGDISTWLERAESGEWERVPDQWQIEELAKAVRNHRVLLKCDGIPPEVAERLFVTPIASIEDAVRELGPDIRIAVLPKGPYVIPVVTPPPSDNP